MRRNIDAAVFLGCGQAEHVIILINRSAYRAQGIVAVGQDIRKRELLKARRPRRLDNPDIRDVMTGHLVKTYTEFLIIT